MSNEPYIYLEVDHNQLEWVAACYLSQDATGIEELNDPTKDLHTDNQTNLILPSRLLAKRFLFRIIFGGTAYSFRKDPDFAGIGGSTRDWDNRIDRFYSKYSGLNAWHRDIIKWVGDNGYYEIPSGRVLHFSLDQNGNYIPSQIKNYPVQGFGADIMALIRVTIRTRLQRLLAPENEHINSDYAIPISSQRNSKSVRSVSTVHDSLLFRVQPNVLQSTASLIQGVWDDFPGLFEDRFGLPFNIKPRCGFKIGLNWGELFEVKNVQTIMDVYNEKLKGDNTQYGI